MKKKIALLLTGMALLCTAGCGRRASGEITTLQRKEAASLAAEAEFAVTVRDLARAEKLLTKVTTLSPDTGDYWLGLGSVRMRLGNRDGAKQAYQAALDAYGDEFKKDKTDGMTALQQVHLLALLGRVDEARKLLEKIQKNLPNDRAVQDFVQRRQLDAMLADPGFKEVSL